MAKTTEKARKGRKPTKGGMQDKIAWIVSNFVEKGKSRSEALHALIKKYPDLSANYLRNVIYKKMEDVSWAGVSKKAAKKGAKKASNTTKKAPVKKAPPKKKPAKKPAADLDDDDDYEDEDDDLI
jgi:hypothetical protein